MKIKSHFSNLKSATEAVRKLKSEGIKNVYVDANKYKGNINNIEMDFIDLVIDSGDNSPLESSIKGCNGSKNSNIFVIIDTEDENFNKVKTIVERMGGVFKQNN